jgi:hypothetical protein
MHVESSTTAARGALAREGALDQEWIRLLFRRRRFLVQRRYQMRVTLIVVGAAFLLLTLLNLSLLASNQRSTAAALGVAPELRPYFESQDRFQLMLTLLGSGAFLLGVFLLGILETHRTAGAAIHICRGIDRLRHGEYRFRVRLRRSDNLREIEQSVNQLASALQEGSRLDASRLDALAAQAAEISGPGSKELESEILALAAERRRLAG